MGKKNSDNFRVSKAGLLPGVFFAFFVRWCVAAYPYSGYQKPPMFGDYEAQRHWQEITLHTPTKDWYYNTTQNDLQYWGLDYPPLTAYHSWVMGVVGDWLDPESVQLFASRGYESVKHKIFMRWTVFLSEIYFYAMPVFLICIDLERVKLKEIKNVFKKTDFATILMLLYPGLILIDHGHFQYNCVSLGFFLWAYFYMIPLDNDVFGTIFFVLALNYKQMELYHSLPFFLYLLRKCTCNLPQRGKLSTFIGRFNRLAIAVITCFIIIWFPFTSSWESIKQVIHRLFPLKRGIFEDKVSNVWCAINVFVKLKTLYTNEEMAKLCLIVTGLAILPSCLDLFIRCNKKKFVLSLINVSLAFFLFSFQVHEKTILLVAIPVALYLPEDPFMCFWFLLVSNFSMLPLLLKDGLLIPFIATNTIYIVFYSLCINLADPTAGLFSFFNAFTVYNSIKPSKIKHSTLLYLLSTNFLFSFIGMVVLTAASVFVTPVPKYPDLMPLLVSVYSCSHFILFFMYFNYQQFIIPYSMPPLVKLKNN